MRRLRRSQPPCGGRRCHFVCESTRYPAILCTCDCLGQSVALEQMLCIKGSDIERK